MNTILQRVDGDRICELIFNDPERRNIFSEPMFDSFETHLDYIDATSPSIVHIRGEGSSFSAGLDLASCVGNETLLASLVERLGTICGRLRRLDAVVVAEIHGHAFAGGSAITSACDIAYASAEAQFGYPVHQIGLSPAVSLPTLMESVGSGPARSLVLSGEIIDAAHALNIGLVHRVLPDREQLATSMHELRRRLHMHPPGILKKTKDSFNSLGATPEADVMSRATQGTIDSVQNPESARMLAEFWAARSQGS